MKIDYQEDQLIRRNREKQQIMYYFLNFFMH